MFSCCGPRYLDYIVMISKTIASVNGFNFKLMWNILLYQEMFSYFKIYHPRNLSCLTLQNSGKKTKVGVKAISLSYILCKSLQMPQTSHIPPKFMTATNQTTKYSWRTSKCEVRNELPKEVDTFGTLNFSIFTLPQIHSSCGRNVFSSQNRKKKREQRKKWAEEKVEWLQLAHMLVIHHT